MPDERADRFLLGSPILGLKFSTRSAALEDADAYLQVTVSDIAALTRKRPSAVSHWRKRSDRPFPEPLTGGRRPLFSAAEVIDWLDEGDLLPAGRPGPAWYWHQAVRLLPAASTHVDRGQLRAFVASLVALGVAIHDRVNADSAPPAGAVLPTAIVPLRRLAATVEERTPDCRGRLMSGLEAVDPDPGVLVLLVTSLEQALIDVATDRRSPAALLDDALATLTELSPGATVTQAVLADLVAAIVSQWEVMAVLDPACGEATLLTRIAQRSDPAPTLVGIEIDQRSASIARTRCDLRRVEAQIHTGNAFDSAVVGGPFDAIVIDPPAGEGSRGASRWLALAADTLAPGGRAAVALPAASLRANASGAHALRQGSVAAVLLLPPTVRHGVRDTQALALLTTGRDHEEVLVLDLTARRPGNTPLPHEQIVELVNGWLDNPDQSTSALSDFTESTRIQARIVRTDDALAGAIGPVSSAMPPQIKDTVLSLQRLLDKHPGIRGSEKLEYALHQFATTHRLSSDD